ncbi:hypothetical protein Bca101_024118 [Brassica carinata]
MASSPKITNLPYNRLSLEDDDVLGETTRRSSSYPYRFRSILYELRNTIGVLTKSLKHMYMTIIIIIIITIR